MSSRKYSNKQIEDFQKLIWKFFSKNARDFAWRTPEANGEFDPYKILVSEVMLQQTQVNRVEPKFQEFMSKFATVHKLAEASLAEVLVVWSGLGYNRRARFLHQAAQMIVREYNGQVPNELANLVALPGIGLNTAGAVLAYAFNKPVVFIETNIRSVYLYHFFKNQIGVTDAAIKELVEMSLDVMNPRQWYWALMDFGSYLKKTGPNPNTASKHFVKQSAFKDSRRYIRGAVIKQLIVSKSSFAELALVIKDPRLTEVLADLVAEGLISKTNDTYTLGK